MSDTTDASEVDEQAAPACTAPELPWTGEDSDLKPLAFRLQLQSLPAILTVLTTIARLGGRIIYTLAADSEATVAMLVPTRLMHRVQPLLGQLVEVIAVSETSLPVAAKMSAVSNFKMNEE